MDCTEARTFLVPFILGALDDDDLSSLRSHIDRCRSCALMMSGDGESMTALAHAVPQYEAPANIERDLFSRIDSQQRSRDAIPRRIRAWTAGFGRRLSPRIGGSIAALIIVMIVAAGVWFDNRLDQMTEDSEQLANELSLARVRESQALDRVSAQRRQTYEALEMSAAPGATVNTLLGTGPWSTARGLMMVSASANRAILVVVNLPPLPSDKVYQVWLVKERRKYGSGWFTVDSTGYGQTVIMPMAPFLEFDGAGVTIEPHGGSMDPTGVSVLKGELYELP